MDLQETQPSEQFILLPYCSGFTWIYVDIQEFTCGFYVQYVLYAFVYGFSKKITEMKLGLYWVGMEL